MDLKQVWFAGSHSDIGGSYKPENDGTLLSDIPLSWMIKQARETGLAFEPHLEQNINQKPTAKLHNSRRSFYRVKKKYYRPIDHGLGEVMVHKSVKLRWDQDDKYRPKNLEEYVDKKGWPAAFEK